VTVIYMDTYDLYKLFMKFNVPGVCEEAGRLAKGVNMGDAGVINEALQAAHDPSAGQRAMQAGEAVQQPSLILTQQDLTSVICAAIQTNNLEIDAAIQRNNTSIGTAVGSVMHSVINQMQTDVEAKRAQDKADAEAKRAQDKADAEAKRAQDKADVEAKMAAYKADTEAKMAAFKADAEAKRAQDKAEIMRALQKDAAGAARVGPVPPYLNRIAEPAPGAPRLGSMQFMPLYRDHIAEPAPGAASVVPIKLKQKRKRHTAMAREKALEWIQKHSSYPYPTREEYEILCQETGVETKERMKGLITTIRQSIWKKKKPDSTPQKTIDEFWAHGQGPAPEIPTGPEGASEPRVGVSDTRNAVPCADKGADNGAGKGADNGAGKGADNGAGKGAGEGRSKTTSEWRRNKVLAEQSGKSFPSWPQDASELVCEVNDTWNVFQHAHVGRQVSTVEWKQARLNLWEQCVDRRVRVQNLQTCKEYNGCCGRVVGLTGERFLVELDEKITYYKKQIILHPKNSILL
jgi:hypothetical protein